MEDTVQNSVESVPTVEASEPQTTTTPEQSAAPSEVATSEQPAESTEQPKSRAQERIRELSDKVNYWKNLAEKQAEPSAQHTSEEQEFLTADEIASRTADVLERRGTQREAQEQFRNDYQATVESYPELTEDEQLAQVVVKFARASEISLKSAADFVIGKQREETQKAELRVLASEAEKASATTASGTRGQVSEPKTLKLSDVQTEDERRANWQSIVASYRK